MLWIEHLHSRLKEHSQIQEDDLVESLTQALNEYSGYYQLEESEEYIKGTVATFDVPLGWIQGFSQIISVEYPLAEVLLVQNPQNYPIPALRDQSDYRLHSFSGTYKLMLLFHVPEGESFRIVYSKPYTMTDVDRVPYHHQGAILNLATSYAFAKLSAVYSQSIRYDIQAESVDYKNRISEYLLLSKWYRSLWETVLGVGKYATSSDDEFGAGIDNTALGYIASKSLPISRRSLLFGPSYERYI